MKSEMCSIVVSPLVSVTRGQVLGFSAAAIGLGEEYEEDEKAAREEKCEIFFGSPETIKPLENGITRCRVNLVGRQLHLQSMKVNKIDRPNTTPTVRGICTIAVYFSVFRPRFVASLLFMKCI